MGLAGVRGDGLELPIDEATGGAGSVLFDPLQLTGAGGMGLIVGEWLLLKIGGYTGATRGRVDGFQARGEGLGCPCATQLENLFAFEEPLDGLAEARPEFDLAGDGALYDLAGYAGVKDK